MRSRCIYEALLGISCLPNEPRLGVIALSDSDHAALRVFPHQATASSIFLKLRSESALTTYFFTVRITLTAFPTSVRSLFHDLNAVGAFV
jgi:hypothetical protein